MTHVGVSPLPEVDWPFHCFVPGAAKTKGSTKAFAIKANNARGMRAVVVPDNKSSQAEWTAFVRQVVLGEWHDAGHDGPIGDAVEFAVEFVLPRRASAPKTFTPLMTRKPDGDKLERALWDAFTRVVWLDDAQVIAWHGRKREAELNETPGAFVWLRIVDL